MSNQVYTVHGVFGLIVCEIRNFDFVFPSNSPVARKQKIGRQVSYGIRLNKNHKYQVSLFFCKKINVSCYIHAVAKNIAIPIISISDRLLVSSHATASAIDPCQCNAPRVS